MCGGVCGIRSRRHCGENFQILNFFWYIVSRIWTEYGKIRTRKRYLFGHFSGSEVDLRWKFYNFLIRSWGKHWEILLVVISECFLWWFDSYWGELKLRKLVNNDCGGRGGGARRNCTCLFGGTVVRRRKCVKMEWHSK